jgi:tetratricopeptide (TPR) repeat protein
MNCRNLFEELVDCNSKLNFDRFTYYKVSQDKNMVAKLKQAMEIIDLLLKQIMPAHVLYTFSRVAEKVGILFCLGQRNPKQALKYLTLALQSVEHHLVGIEAIRPYDLKSLILFANSLDEKANKPELIKSLQMHLASFTTLESQFKTIERFTLSKMFAMRIMILTFLNAMQQNLDANNIRELNYLIDSAKDGVTKLTCLRFNYKIRSDLAESFCLIGLLYNKLNEFRLASGAFHSSWLHWNLFNSETGTTHPCIFISELYHAKALQHLKDYPESIKKFGELLEALSDYYKGNINDSFASTTYDLAKVYEAAEDYENAINRYLEVFLFYSNSNPSRSATIRLDINRVINTLVNSMPLLPPFRLTYPETMCFDDSVLALMNRRLEILQLFSSYTTAEQKKLIGVSARNLIAHREFRLNRKPPVNSLITLPSSLFKPTTWSPLFPISEEDVAVEDEQKTPDNALVLRGSYYTSKKPAAATQQRLLKLAVTEVKNMQTKSHRH